MNRRNSCCFGSSDKDMCSSQMFSISSTVSYMVVSASHLVMTIAEE